MNEVILESTASNPTGALTANLHAHVALYSSLPGAIVWDEPEILALLTDLDPSESCVYRASFARGQVDQKIEQVLGRFGIRGCLPMYWQVGPSSLPVDLGKHLQAQGFAYFVRAPGMAADLRDLAGVPSDLEDLRIGRVENTSQLVEWMNIVAAVGGFSDGLRDGLLKGFGNQELGPKAANPLFLGTEKGRPVATSRLMCAGGVAGIYHVATLPEARGRGYGTAMTLAAANAGRELGYRVGVLYATSAGYGIYRRLGFREYCHVDVYVSPS